MKLNKREHAVFIFFILYIGFMLFFIPVRLKAIPWAVITLEFVHFAVLIFCIYSYVNVVPKPIIRRKEYKKNRFANLMMLFNIKSYTYDGNVYSSLKRLPEYDAWLNNRIYEFYLWR